MPKRNQHFRMYQEMMKIQRNHDLDLTPEEKHERIRYCCRMDLIGRQRSFVLKYGIDEGLARMSYIGKVAVQARWKAHYRDA